MGKKALDFVPHKGTNYYKNGAVVELKAKTDENCQLTEVASSLNLKKLAHSCDTSPTRFTTISYGGSELIDQTPICAKGALFIINLGESKIVPTNNQSKEDIK